MLLPEEDSLGRIREVFEFLQMPRRPFVIARGHDPQYLDSYSVKKADQEEID